MTSVLTHNNKWIIACGLSALGTVLSGCANNDTGTTASVSGASVTEIAGSSVAGSANSTEAGGSMAYLDRSPTPLRDFFEQRLSPINEAQASTSCPTLAGAACVGSAITLDYSDCSFGRSAAVWNGSQILTFTSGSCTTHPELSSSTLTRTFGAGTTRLGANGVSVAFDSADATGYNTPVSGGMTVVWSGGSRSLTINGINYVASLNGGSALFNHTVSSGPLTIDGVGANRVVEAGGVITVQHNLKQVTGTATITQNLTFSAGCCHPTGGEISTSLSDGSSETLTYNSTCGSATLVNANGSSDITLNYCL